MSSDGEWVVILQGLQGHLREAPLSAFLALCHAQRRKLKMNQQKVPNLFMPLKASRGLKGTVSGAAEGTSGSLCPVLRCTAENGELESQGCLVGMFYFF